MKSLIKDKHIFIHYNHDHARIIPDAYEAELQGKRVLCMPHTLQHARILNNLGYQSWSPIMTEFNWPIYKGTKPMTWYQKHTANFLTLHKKAAVLNQVGTMKTGSVICAAEYLLSVGEVRRILVVCPKSCVRHVWLNELFDVTPWRQAGILLAEYGSSRSPEFVSNKEWLITNHDGIKTHSDLIKVFNPDIIVLDEMDKFKDRTTDRFKVLEKLVLNVQWFWPMTGTPLPNSIVDGHAISTLINPRTPKSTKAFKNMLMLQVAEHKWVPRANGLALAFSYLQPAIRLSREDCGIVLPPVVRKMVHVEMTDEQKTVFNDMLKRSMVELESGLVTAANAAVRHGKLMQIASGILYKNSEDENGRAYKIAVEHRARAMLPDIKEAKKKFIISCDFSEVLPILKTFLKENGYDVAVINGSVSTKKRDDIIQDFKYGEINGILIHPETMSHGNTLVQADLLIYYTPPGKTAYKEQTDARIDRPGQDMSPKIVSLYSTPQEKATYETHELRQGTQKNFLDLYREMIYAKS